LDRCKDGKEQSIYAKKSYLVVWFGWLVGEKESSERARSQSTLYAVRSPTNMMKRKQKKNCGDKNRNSEKYEGIM